MDAVKEFLVLKQFFYTAKNGVINLFAQLSARAKIGVLRMPTSLNHSKGLGKAVKRSDAKAMGKGKLLWVNSFQHLCFIFIFLLLSVFPVEAQGEYDQALKNYLLGDFRRAQTILGPLLKTEWNNFDVVMLAGHVSWKNGQMSWAIGNFEQAKRLKPQNENSYLAKTEMLLDFGKAALARAEIQQLIQKQPKNHKAWNLVARIELQEERTPQAIQAAEMAISLEPNNYVAYNILGLIYLGRKDLKKAEIAFRSAYSLAPQSSHVVNNMGVIMEKQGNREKAREFYEKALSLNSKHPTARENLKRLGSN